MTEIVVFVVGIIKLRLKKHECNVNAAAVPSGFLAKENFLRVSRQSRLSDKKGDNEVKTENMYRQPGRNYTDDENLS